jgi:dTDP-4-dehydrorhamnose reductase
MRALVIGASGQVGGAIAARLSERGHHVVGTHRGTPQPDTRPLDVTDAAATERYVAEIEPDWVVCPAALTAVDYCEGHPDEAFAANRDAPGSAARAAAKRGAGFVYFSTEYVFDGTAGPYTEGDPPNPQSIYARSKLEGERRAVAENPRTIVVRTTVVYGPERQGKNTVYQMLARARRRDRIQVPRDQVTSPTYNVDLAAATVELIERDFRGVLNVAGPEVMDRHAFALEVCAAFGLDPGLVDGVTTESMRQPARRPLNAGLVVDRARALLQTPLRGPREGLRDMRKALEARGQWP